MSLPTFSELMASLHLRNTGEPDSTNPMADEQAEVEAQAEAERELQLPTSSRRPSISSNSPPTLSISPILQTHLPSTSKSPSITISNLEISNATISSSLLAESTNSTRFLSQRNSTRSIRFTPYSGASKSVHIRRSSLPHNWKENSKPKSAIPARPSTVSPRLPSCELRLQDLNINVIRKSPSSHLPTIRSSTPSIHVDIENSPNVPISSFARRKTPQSSPTTTQFRQRRRSGSFSPVLLPTLLPGLQSSSPPRLNSPDICEAVATQLTATDRPRIVRQQQGLRLSSYRSFYIEDKSRRVISAG